MLPDRSSRRIPNRFGKREVESAPGPYAQLRQVVCFEIVCNGAMQAVETDGARNILPLAERSIKWKRAEGDGRQPQTLGAVRAQSAADGPGSAANLLINSPGDIVDRPGCILGGRGQCQNRFVRR
jgi:hypothetical protein